MDKKIICQDIFGHNHEVSVEKISFRPSVYGILINDNKVLLAKEAGFYDFPGGGIEIDEIIEKALVREMKEETGYDVKPKKIISCQDSFFHLPSSEKFVHGILIYYICELLGGTLSTALFDEYEKEYAETPEWISLSETKNLKFRNSPDRLEILQLALKN